MWPAAPHMLRCLWAQSNNQTKPNHNQTVCRLFENIVVRINKGDWFWSDTSSRNSTAGGYRRAVLH
jgi:hypothetical protein